MSKDEKIMTTTPDWDYVMQRKRAAMEKVKRREKLTGEEMVYWLTIGQDEEPSEPMNPFREYHSFREKYATDDVETETETEPGEKRDSFISKLKDLKRVVVDDSVSPAPIPDLMAMKVTGGAPDGNELSPEEENAIIDRTMQAWKKMTFG